MNDLTSLRKLVELPVSYNIELPEAERKRLLLNALAELKLRDNILNSLMCSGAKKDSHVGLHKRFAVKPRVARCVATHGPMTGQAVAKMLNLDNQRVSHTLYLLKESGHVVSTSSTWAASGHKHLIYTATDSGIDYGKSA